MIPMLISLLSWSTSIAWSCEPYLEVRAWDPSLFIRGGAVKRCGSDGDLNVEPVGLPTISRKLTKAQLARFQKAVKLAKSEAAEILGPGRKTATGGRSSTFKFCPHPVTVRIGDIGFKTCPGTTEFDVAKKIDLLIHDVYRDKY